MATSDQVKSLIKAHFENNQERFNTLALQIAAHEAKIGHPGLAFEIRDLIDKNQTSKVVQLRPLNNDLTGLILETDPKIRKSELIVSDQIKSRIDRIVAEYLQRQKLQSFGLINRRKILLAGEPGTGKTMTASVIARELNLPLFIILMDRLVTKFMGESSNKLRQIFEIIKEKKGVYFFDEFDTIGGERAKDNDVGEMRRILNSFLHFIEKDESESLIIAATNNISLLDQALFRRFDDIMKYELPTKDEILMLIGNKLEQFKSSFKIESIVAYAEGLSHAEITQACHDAIKESVLSGKIKIYKALISRMLMDRKSHHK